MTLSCAQAVLQIVRSMVTFFLAVAAGLRAIARSISSPSTLTTASWGSAPRARACRMSLASGISSSIAWAAAIVRFCYLGTAWSSTSAKEHATELV
jgi:hypothetical protein